MKRVAVIDGFSSGKFIAKRLYDMGCILVHISSSSDLDEYYYNGFDYSIYNDHIIHDDIEDTLSFINKNEIECIFAGAESGVILSDLLNSRLTLSYKNSYEKSSARRNKYDMIESLREYGIKATNQIKVDDWNSALKWIKKNQYPIVVKPLESAGSDNVFICKNEAEAKSAFHKIFSKKNKLNIMNDFVLFQEFLKGSEYVVNFVSLNGNILVTEVVKYHKRKLYSGNIVYDIDELIDSTYPEFIVLTQYVKQVCISLGIKNGPSHAEVMLTESGPCLVEIAARSDGILRPDVSSSTTGLGQIEATAISIAKSDRFLELLQQPSYIIKNYSFNVCLISPIGGAFLGDKFRSFLEDLPSFFKSEFYVAENATIGETKDVFSQPGTIYLVSERKEKLWEDHNKIRNFELSRNYLNELAISVDSL